ncbi:membrane protein insertase YidC [Sphingobacterium hungaricum]
MDRSTLTGLILIFAIFAGSFYFMKPSEQEIKQEQALQDSLKRVKEGVTEPLDTTKITTTLSSTSPDSAALAQPFGASKFGQEQIVTIENELIRVNISSKGGRVKSVELKNETNFDGSPLLLFEGDNNKFGLLFNASGLNVNTNDMFFQLQGGNFSVAGADSQSIKARLNYNETQYIEYTYTLAGNSYNVGLAIDAIGIQNSIDLKQKNILLNWETTLLQKEKNVKSEREKSTIFYKTSEGDVDHLSEAKDDSEKIEEKLEWIAFKQHFFSSILSNKEGFTNPELFVNYTTSDSIVKVYKTTADLAFNSQSDNRYAMNFFFGPNKYKTLKAEDQGYDKIINMGWGPIGWINKFITVPIFDFLDGFHMSYGIVILILTILLKAVLFPLTYKSYKSMAKMRVLKPQLDQIKEKVGDDNPMLLQQEQMKLYKQAGVNPIGGCLPLLLQMPFTLAFFFFFPNLFELRGESFLWVKDLSTYDSWISFPPTFFGIDHISLMCVLMTITTLLTTWYNNSTSGATGQMKYIGYFMPLIFFFVLNSFPAGLNYYYLLGAVFTFLTQVIIRQFIDDDKILASLEANKKNPKVAKKSSFQQRMEDMMKQQQQAKKK